jgi:hypothetical protein
VNAECPISINDFFCIWLFLFACKLSVVDVCNSMEQFDKKLERTS